MIRYLCYSLVMITDLVSTDSRGVAFFEAFGLSKDTCGQTVLRLTKIQGSRWATYNEHEDQVLCRT